MEVYKALLLSSLPLQHVQRAHMCISGDTAVVTRSMHRGDARRGMDKCVCTGNRTSARGMDLKSQSGALREPPVPPSQAQQPVKEGGQPLPWPGTQSPFPPMFSTPLQL